MLKILRIVQTEKSFYLSLFMSACVCVCVWRVVHCIIPFQAKLKTGNKNNSNNNWKCSKAIRFLLILQLKFSSSSVIIHFNASLCVCARGKIYGKRTNELKKAILLLKFQKLHKFLVSFSLVYFSFCKNPWRHGYKNKCLKIALEWKTETFIFSFSGW